MKEYIGSSLVVSIRIHVAKSDNKILQTVVQISSACTSLPIHSPNTVALPFLKPNIPSLRALRGKVPTLTLSSSKTSHVCKTHATVQIGNTHLPSLAKRRRGAHLQVITTALLNLRTASRLYSLDKPRCV